MDYKDISLLGALDILLNEGSVVGAAEKLHLSSSAVSRILARIRAVTGDDILVPAGRTTRGLCPDSGKTDSESVGFHPLMGRTWAWQKCMSLIPKIKQARRVGPDNI